MKKNTWALITALVVMAALPITYNLISRSTETRRRATGDGICNVDYGCFTNAGEVDCNCEPLAADSLSSFKDKNYKCGGCGYDLPASFPYSGIGLSRKFSAASNLGVAVDLSPVPLVTITKLEEAEGEINNSSMMINAAGVGDSKFPLIPFQSKTDDYYKVIKCLNAACTKHVVDNMSHIETTSYEVWATDARCGCNSPSDGQFCYEKYNDPTAKKNSPCVGCSRCFDQAKCTGGTGGYNNLYLNSAYVYCTSLKRNITYAEFCTDPDYYQICNDQARGVKTDPCVCCNLTGYSETYKHPTPYIGKCSMSQWLGPTPAYEVTEKTAQGIKWYRTVVLKGNNGLPMIAFNYIPLPTNTPTATPIATGTPTSTPIPTNTPTRAPFVARRDPISVLSYKVFDLSPVPSRAPNTKITDDYHGKYYTENPFDEIKLNNLSSLWMAMDTNKFPIITFYDTVNGSLKLIKCEDEYCADGLARYVVPVVVPSSGSNTLYGQYHAMVVDKSNFPMIAFSREDGQGDSDLMYVKCNSIDCKDKNEPIILESDGVVGWDISMYYDSNLDVPVISYYDKTKGQLKMVRCDNPACSGLINPLVIDGDGFANVGRYSSIVRDFEGKAVLAYYDLSNFDLKFVRCNTNDCSSKVMMTLDKEGDTGRYPVIAIGGDGNPIISYFQVQTGNEGWIKVAKCANYNCGAAPTSTPTKIPATPTVTLRPTATPTPTSAPAKCECVQTAGYCYEANSSVQWNPCTGCSMCKDFNRGNDMIEVSVSNKYQCSAMGREIALGEYCANPTFFAKCNLSIDLCQCCNLIGSQKNSSDIGRCTEGVCSLIFTPTPTKVPTSTPTPTEVPRIWQNMCKSVELEMIVPTITSTPTPTFTPTPTKVPCPVICSMVNASYSGPDKYGADYNCDGVINGADYVVWRNEFIDKITTETKQSDGTCDGKITISDYSRWREMYLK